VLILDGEELVGAKQNRIVNVTILVVTQSEIVIPVS
jgi:ARG and Rhodanese-Phosphatase-superfamily-associated Protein domain